MIWFTEWANEQLENTKTNRNMKTTIELTSKRKFVVAFIESDQPETFTSSMSDILTDDGYEWKYAVMENIDRILDLRPEERCLLSFNRDNPDDSTGFIKRIR